MPTVSGVCRSLSNGVPLRRGIPTLLLLLQESALLAQGTGTSPWVMAVDELSKTILITHKFQPQLTGDRATEESAQRHERVEEPDQRVGSGG